MSTIDELLDKAFELREDEKYEDSISILEEVFLQNPTDKIKKPLVDTLFLAGGYYNDIYVLEYDKAVDIFSRIIEIEPENYRAHYNLGIANSNLGKPDIALESYKKAIKYKPDYKHCYYNIGLIYEEKEDLRSALTYYEKALDIDPQFPYALQALHHVRQILDSQRGANRPY